MALPGLDFGVQCPGSCLRDFHPSQREWEYVGFPLRLLPEVLAGARMNEQRERWMRCLNEVLVSGIFFIQI